MKLFNLTALAVIAVKAIKESINLENVFECWIDSIIEDSPLSIKVAVTPYCDMYRVSIRLFNLDTEQVIHSETHDTDKLSTVKELVSCCVRALNLDNPALEPEAPALSNLDAEKPVIDVYVTTKHKGEFFCWCAESEEYKVMGDTRADAVNQIKEAMILDGITNPELNIIDGDYDNPPTPPATKADTMAQTETTGSTNVKLFFSTFANKLSASYINQAVSAGKQYRVTFESLNYTDLECELIITDSQTHSIFDYSITLTDNKIGTVYDIVTGGAASVSEIKEMARTCADAWNAENPAFEAERKEYDDAYNALKKFGDEISGSTEKLALETLLNVALEQDQKHAVVMLTALLTNDFDYENSGYMISSLEHSYQDRYIWDAATVHQLNELIKYIDGLNPTDPEPTKKLEQPADNGEATEKHTIGRVFGEHGFTKCQMDGYEVINDPEGREVCRVRGSLRTRLAYKWLIVDALVNGRDEQQNEDDFAALNAGDFFDLTFEDGSTRSAGKVDDLQLVCEVFGRHTTINFQRRWLVTVNPAHKEAFLSLPIGTKLKLCGDHFTVSSHSIGEEGEPRAGLVNAQGQVMTSSIKAVHIEQQRDQFLSLPIGQPFACDLENGDHIPEAIKTSSLGFTFKHFGTMKTMIFKPGMVCDPEWPISPDHRLIQDPHNKQKQYILKRENFLEITVFQMVAGQQVSRAKFTEDELLLTYDFIYQYQLNKLLSGNCNSAHRLYKIKQPFLVGGSKDWRIDAKLSCINPDSLNFLTHVAKENALKPLIIRTAEAMEKTVSYGPAAVPCWYNKASIDGVLREAERAGYVSRMSTTQIHWTDAGSDALRAAIPSGF